MATSILLTQCLQNDFVGPLGPHEPLPNGLHVGYTEARRLLGEDPRFGPLGQLLSWLDDQPAETIELIHVRDWHDRSDPHQGAHLRRFGNHCLAETPGAELVLSMDQRAAERHNHHLVDARGLNDFEGTALGPLLERVLAGHDRGSVRVGVIGVWTEAKVTFLLYDLKTRLGIDNLATCTALTASASRSQHFNAHAQLRSLLGVQVLDSVGEFGAWLLPQAHALPSPEVSRYIRPHLTATSDPLPPCDDDTAILAHLYRNSSCLELNGLTGGFSGARVYQVRSFDDLGHEQAPSVTKLGPRTNVAAERIAFEKVEAILGNHAPSIKATCDFGARGGLRFAYAAMGAGEVQTFKRIYEAGAEAETIARVLETVFHDLLGRLYAAAHYERLALLSYYGFSDRYSDSVRTRVGDLTGQDPNSVVLEFPGDYLVRNVADFYQEALSKIGETNTEYHYVSYIHGDLNGANILVDGQDNVWLIDFFHTHRGHVLRDLAKLENDLLYILTPLEGEAELAQALLLTRRLRRVDDLAAPLPETLTGLELPALRRAWQTLRVVRRVVAQVCRDDRNPTQLDVALLRYAVHTTTFEESSVWQRRWALAAACGYAEDIAANWQRNRALRVDWIEAAAEGLPGRLGVTICPGRKDQGRELKADVETLRELGVDLVVCLVSQRELEWAGVSELGSSVRATGMRFFHSSIRDQKVPSMPTARALVDLIVSTVEAGDAVVVHCMGGLGRSGLIAASVMVQRGVDAVEAVRCVRAVRGLRAVETRAQERFVEDFAGAMHA